MQPVYTTKQEIFDKVCERLADGRGQALQNGACVYRSPEGVPCAIGALIPDEVVQHINNGAGVRLVVQESPEFCALFAPELNVKPEFANITQPASDAVWLMQMLQAAHDDPDHWVGKAFVGWDKVRSIAAEFNLMINPDQSNA